jgi:hypothetical protein
MQAKRHADANMGSMPDDIDDNYLDFEDVKGQLS